MAQIVVLGGGFGGIAAAAALTPAARAGHHVTVVERRSEFLMGLRKLWILCGKGTRAEGTRPVEALRRHGAEVVRDEVVAIEPAAGRVRTTRGEIPFDYLIVALGAEPRPDLVPGFEHAGNLYDADEVERLSVAIEAIREGTVVVGILGVPYKCPPAPYEAAMLLHDYFVAKGVRAAVELRAFTVQPIALPVAGPEASRAVADMLADRGIAFEAGRKGPRIEPGRVVVEGGEIAFDLLLGVPPHRPPRVIAESGLGGNGGWIRPDPSTLRTVHENVYAVGDVIEIPLANGMAIPKAGVFAEAQARIAAGGILHALGLGPEPAPFDGQGYCFIETGSDRAAFVRGRFLASPVPEIEMSEPSADSLERKRRFERERLDAWFGG